MNVNMPYDDAYINKFYPTLKDTGGVTPDLGSALERESGKPARNNQCQVTIEYTVSTLDELDSIGNLLAEGSVPRLNAISTKWMGFLQAYGLTYHQ